jgi:hypothetical protein
VPPLKSSAAVREGIPCVRGAAASRRDPSELRLGARRRGVGERRRRRRRHRRKRAGARSRRGGRRLLPRALPRLSELRGARPASGDVRRARGGARRRRAARLSRRARRRPARPLAPLAKQDRDGGRAAFRRRSGDDSPRGDRARAGKRRLRDDRRPRRSASRHDRAQVGRDADAADRARGRRPLPSGRRVPRGCDRPDVRRRRPRNPHIPGDDRAHHPHPRSTEPDRGGADLTPRLSSYWLHLVTPVKAGVARPLVEGLRNPTIGRDERIRRLFLFALTPFDDAVRSALAPD